MRALLLLAVVMLVTACAAVTKPAPTAAPETAASHPTDPQSLTEELKLTVLESYRAIGSDYTEAYQETLTKGSRSIFVGARRGDVAVGFDAERGIAIHRYFPEDRLEIVSQDLLPHLSEDKGVGWVSDHLSYRVGRGRRQASVPLRATALYLYREGRWGKALEHVSYPRPLAALLADARADRIGTPALIPSSVVGAEAEAAVSAVHRFLGDGPPPTVPGDFLLIAPWDAEVHQSQTVGGMFGKGVAIKAEAFFVEVAPGRTAAWVAANLMAVGKDFSLPLRATWVLERRGGEFMVVQMHLSAPLPDDPAGVMFGGK